MPLTAAQAALQLPGAEAVTAVVLRPTDPGADDVVVVQALSDREFWGTLAGEPLSFRHLLVGGVSLSESLTRPGQLTGESDPVQGSFVVELTEGMATTWFDLDWNERPCELYLGAWRGADGERMDLDEFDVWLVGVVDRVRRRGSMQAEVYFSDATLDFDRPLVLKLYRGFGGALRIVGAADAPAGSRVFLRGGTAPDPTPTTPTTIAPPFTFEVVGRLRSFQPGTNGTLLGVGWGATFNEMNARIRVSSAGELVAVLDTGAASQSFNTGHVAAIDRPFYGALVLEDDGVTARLYAGEDADDTLPVWETTLATPMPGGDWNWVQVGELQGPGFDAWEVRLWSSAKTQEELEDLGDGPVTDAATRTDLVESWRFSEGVVLGTGPEVAFGERGLLDLVNGDGGSPEWSSSYEGDDPDLFEGSPFGRSRARVYGGPVRNVPLVPVDSQRHLLGWDDEAVDEVLVQRMRGVPMVRRWSVAASAPGDVSFDAATNSIVLASAAVGSFGYAVPGQVEPARLGQRVQVTDATLAANRGVFRVAVDGVSDDGLRLAVVDRYLQAESGPATVVVQSYEPDAQYEVDLQHAVSVLNSNPTGDVTADLVGRMPPGGEARWSELFELATGAVPDTTSVVFDPVLGVFIEPGSSPTLKEFLDGFARSAFGWWVKSGGVYKLGNFRPPSGAVVADLRPPLCEFEPLDLADPTPFWRVPVRFARNWSVQDGDALATSVSQADRQRWGAQYLEEPWTDRRVQRRFPASREHPGLETWLVERADAVTYAAMAGAMLSRLVPVAWYKVTFSSLWAAFIQVDDVVTASEPDDPSLGLSLTPLRIVTRELDTGDGTVTLEGHT
jgi:hypothetical protein